MIEAEPVEDGGVEVASVDEILGRAEADVVGLAVAESAFHAAAGQPDGEGVRVMIACRMG